MRSVWSTGIFFPSWWCATLIGAPYALQFLLVYFVFLFFLFIRSIYGPVRIVHDE